MAELGMSAVTTDQGDSSICVCAALAMAATEGGHLENAPILPLGKIIPVFLQHLMMLASKAHKENFSLTW